MTRAKNTRQNYCQNLEILVHFGFVFFFVHAVKLELKIIYLHC